MIDEDEAAAQLLQQRIEESGLSTVQFAAQVLRRSERTVRRWLARKAPVSHDVRAFLEDPQPAPWP